MARPLTASAAERRRLAEIRATTSPCRWCGYRLPLGQEECAPRGDVSDRWGSHYCASLTPRRRFEAIHGGDRSGTCLGSRSRQAGDLAASLHRAGYAYAEIARVLTSRGVQPANRGEWSAARVAQLLYRVRASR